MENIGLPKSIKPRPFWVQYVSTYIVFFLSLFVCKVKVNGRKNIPKDGPFVLASNHFGYFDPFVLVHAIRKPIDFIMQKELGIEFYFLFALLAINIAPGLAFERTVLVIPPSGKIPKTFPFLIDFSESLIVDGPTLFLSVKIAP